MTIKIYQPNNNNMSHFLPLVDVVWKKKTHLNFKILLKD